MWGRIASTQSSAAQWRGALIEHWELTALGFVLIALCPVATVSTLGNTTSSSGSRSLGCLRIVLAELVLTYSSAYVTVTTK